MDADEWQTCASPWPLLSFLNNNISRRKRALFACACWGRTTFVREHPICLDALYIGERLGEGKAAAAEWDAAVTAVRDSLPWLAELPPVYAPLLAAFDWNRFIDAGPRLAAQVRAMELSALHGGDSQQLIARPFNNAAYAIAMVAAQQELADLVRHLFANPFRPTPTPDRLPRLVRQLGEAAYASAPDAVGPLYDALLDAGLSDLAEHFADLRQAHPRGCWALDLLTGLD